MSHLLVPLITLLLVDVLKGSCKMNARPLCHTDSIPTARSKVNTYLLMPDHVSFFDKFISFWFIIVAFAMILCGVSRVSLFSRLVNVPEKRKT